MYSRFCLSATAGGVSFIRGGLRNLQYAKFENIQGLPFHRKPGPSLSAGGRRGWIEDPVLRFLGREAPIRKELKDGGVVELEDIEQLNAVFSGHWNTVQRVYLA